MSVVAVDSEVGVDGEHWWVAFAAVEQIAVAWEGGEHLYWLAEVVGHHKSHAVFDCSFDC